MAPASRLMEMEASQIDAAVARFLAASTQNQSSDTTDAVNHTSAIPLSTYIHLPVDASDRDRILSTMRQPKLQAAYRYMAERVRFLNLRVPHRQGECFDLPNGDAVNSGFDVIPLDSQFSLRDVYEEFQFWLRHEEITISEKIGVLTIRESDDSEHFQYNQSRLLTTILDGVEIESNMALFVTCEDGTVDNPGFALCTIDFVDQDDLYPYRSTEIGRKEQTGAILLVEVPMPDGSKAVSMCRWSFVRFRGPTGGMDCVQQGAVRDTMVGLCDMMPKLMAERLAMRASGTTSSSECDLPTIEAYFAQPHVREEVQATNAPSSRRPDRPTHGASLTSMEHYRGFANNSHATMIKTGVPLLCAARYGHTHVLAWFFSREAVTLLGSETLELLLPLVAQFDSRHVWRSWFQEERLGDLLVLETLLTSYVFCDLINTDHHKQLILDETAGDCQTPTVWSKSRLPLARAWKQCYCRSNYVQMPVAAGAFLVGAEVVGVPSAYGEYPRAFVAHGGDVRGPELLLIEAAHNGCHWVDPLPTHQYRWACRQLQRAHSTRGSVVRG